MTRLIQAPPGATELLLFRVGGEFFALPLRCAEEAIEALAHESVPGMPDGMLGVASCRGRRLSVYAPDRVLGVPCGAAAAVTLVVHALDRRIGLLVDDVEDVIMFDAAQMRPLPGPDAADTVLRGVVHHGSDLVAVCDAESLVRACGGGGA